MQTLHCLLGLCCVAVLATAGSGPATSLNSTDKTFLVAAAKTDMIEAHESQIAEGQAKRADVKDFAKTLVQESGDSYEHLTELAAKTGASIPKGIDAARVAAIQRLNHVKGDRFDQEFIKSEIAADRQAIALFKHEAADGYDADVKAYVAKTIPVLEKDLQLAGGVRQATEAQLIQQ